MCTAVLPEPSWAIWLRQEKPPATIGVCGAASRTAGRRTRSAHARQQLKRVAHTHTPVSW